MARQPIIPVGSWPRRMNAAYSAGYVGERASRRFLAALGLSILPPG